MIKRKKTIAVLLTIALVFSFTGIGVQTPVSAAEMSNYTDRNDYGEYEGKDSNGLTWKYFKNNDGSISLNGTSDLSGTVIIPDKVDGLKVTGLYSVVRFYPSTIIHGNDYNRACNDGSIVTKVIMPESLEFVGDAFYCCKNLEQVDFSQTVKYFKISDFSGKWTEKYKNSDGLAIINNILVNGMSAKGKISIPDNVNEIADSAFYNVYGGNDEITEVSIPSNVKRIGERAFRYCSNLKKVKISDGLKEIGDYAFGDCTSLCDLEMPDDIEKISKSAFDNCYSLDNRTDYTSDGLLIDENGVLTLGDSAKGDVVIPDNVKEIKQEAFRNNTRITSVKISGNTKVIGESAFEGCSNLKDVIIEDGLQSIENKAFRESGVKKVTIPDSIEKFGMDVFYGCSSLEEASNRGNGLIVTQDGTLCCGYAAKGDVVVPDDIKEIQSYAFFGNNKITSVTIPGNIKKIGAKAFQDCTNITKVYLGEGINEIEIAAFLNCSKLTSIILPDSLQKIGKSAFASCSSLVKVSYKEGLDIGNAFQYTPWNENKVNSEEKVPSNVIVNAEKPEGNAVGRQYKNGKWYYYNMDGTSPKGWYFDLPYGKWYYLNDDGSMKTGWFYYPGYSSWFYFDSDGSRHRGWLYDPNYGSWFFLNDDGTMKTGWMYDYNYGSWFYLNSNGTMRTGWFYDSSYGKWYYLYSNGVMARSTYVDGYYVNSSGAWVY